MTVVESYLLSAHQEEKGPIPTSQLDLLIKERTLVETPYGFGVIDTVNPTFEVVKVALLNPDMQSVNPSASVSLPWEKIRILPDTSPCIDTDSGRDKRKEPHFESRDSITKKRTPQPVYSLSRPASRVVMLNEIEKAIEEVRERRRILLRLREVYDVTEQPPEMVPVLPRLDFHDDSYRFPHIDGLSSSSRSMRSRHSQLDEFTFAPKISERSRRIASRLPRDASYRKSSADQVGGAHVESKGPVPEVSAVTTAIANRIKNTYGSLEEYYKQRRENASTYKDLTSRKEAEELKECTFHPIVVHEPIPPRSVNATEIGGFDSFLKRLEKAREKRVQVEDCTGPGSGHVYTGEPTKVKPFSFLKKSTSTRTRIRE